MSIFKKIINKEIPAHIVAENEEFIAFLDINPITIGHTLVIPKKETDYIFDIEDKDLGRLVIFAKSVAQAMKKTISCGRIGMAVSGFEIPHTHIHLVPINKASDMSPNNKVIPQTNEELANLALKINKCYDNI